MSFLNFHRLTLAILPSKKAERLFLKTGLMILMPKGKKDKLIRLKQEPPTLESGSEASEMGMASNSGQTEPGMKASGKTTELMARENLRISTETFMKETG